MSTPRLVFRPPIEAPALQSSVSLARAVDTIAVSAPQALDARALRGIFGYLDGTSLTRVSAVCKAWRTAACDETLWHGLMAREKPSPYLMPRAVEKAPCWALEQPASPQQAALCSWRQAYRLSAMWERGRPDAGWPKAHAQLSTQAAPLRSRQHDLSVVPRCRLFAVLDARHGPLSLLQIVEALAAVEGSHFNIQTAQGHTALRNSRGEVVVFWGEGQAFARTALALGKQGRLSRKVLLLSAAATKDLPSAQIPSTGDTALPRCITVCGRHIDAWQPQSGASLWSTRLETALPGGPPGKVQTRVLGAQGRQFLATWAWGLAASAIDLNTGHMWWRSDDDEKLCGLSLLTPEAGPLVGWNRYLHFRSWPMTDMASAQLPESRFWTRAAQNRPVRTWGWDAIPDVGFRVRDVQVDARVPGGLVAALEPTAVGDTLMRSLTISGWGASSYIETGMRDERFTLGAATDTSRVESDD